MDDVVAFKQGNRATWAAGDFDQIAELVWPVGARCVEHAGVRAGDEVLDVACGTGNAATRAALAGGRVTGADLTPELFEAGRRRAAAAGVEIEWVQADAEDLPFPDESFDVVLSTFGCMFAPRHELTAGEIARVLRPGGRISLCNWTPEGWVGEFFRATQAHLPPPPAFASPPLLWGTEDHVRGLFAGSAIDFDFHREGVTFSFDSAEAALEEYATKFGPTVMARAALEPEGRWDALRDDLIALFARDADAGGAVTFDAEYLVVRGTKRS